MLGFQSSSKSPGPTASTPTSQPTAGGGAPLPTCAFSHENLLVGSSRATFRMWCCRTGGTSPRRPCSEMTPAGQKRNTDEKSCGVGASSCSLAHGPRHRAPFVEIRRGLRVPSCLVLWSPAHRQCASSAQTRLPGHILPSQGLSNSVKPSPSTTGPKKPFPATWPTPASPYCQPRTQPLVSISGGVRHWRSPETAHVLSINCSHPTPRLGPYPPA